MKKIHVILLAMLLMLCTANTAYADAIGPLEGFVRDGGLVILLIAVAVIAAAIIFFKIKNKKK